MNWIDDEYYSNDHYFKPLTKWNYVNYVYLWIDDFDKTNIDMVFDKARYIWGMSFVFYLSFCTIHKDIYVNDGKWIAKWCQELLDWLMKEILILLFSFRYSVYLIYFIWQLIIIFEWLLLSFVKPQTKLSFSILIYWTYTMS